MKIKRFNEAEQLDISNERVDEIVENVKDFVANLSEKQKMVDSLISEFSNYKSDSSKGNDQVDDSIASLQYVKKT